MNFKPQLLIFILLIALGIQCTKSEVDGEHFLGDAISKVEKPITYINADTIYAGIYDTSFYFHEFSPPITIVTEFDSTNGWYYKHETFLLPMDTFNFEFQCILLLDNPNTSIPTSEHFNVLSYDSLFFNIVYKTYLIAHGQTTTFTFVRAFNEGQQIAIKNQAWTNHYSPYTSKWFSLWSNPVPGGVFPVGYDSGEWYNKKSIHYIAFNHKNRLGWIKVNNSNLYEPQFISFAMQKKPKNPLMVDE